MIGGKLFIRISVPKSDENDIPTHWRFEIVKACKIACVHNTLKSSPFCEVSWRGSVERQGTVEESEDWLDIGFTRFKEKTLDPKWNKDEGNIFETPPFWTDCNVPERGLNDAALTGGAWVARNNLPPDDPAARTNKLSALDRLRVENKAAKEAAEQKASVLFSAYSVLSLMPPLSPPTPGDAKNARK